MKAVSLFVLASFFLAACGAAPDVVLPTSEGDAGGGTPQVSPTDAPLNAVTPTSELPIEGGNTLTNPRIPSIGEYSFNQLLPFDGIRPVYEPVFAAPAEVNLLLQDDELVLGMNLEDEAKAYPISVLRFREMVNDEMAGIPTLVTW